MPKIRVYVDTSVFGGVEDEEFAEFSRRFFDRVRRGDFTVLVSPQTIAELEKAPPAILRVLETLPPEDVETVPVDAEVESLAEAYVAAGALGVASRGDAIHVAAATVAKADLILSWNFRHIVRYDRIQKFNGVNALKGYHALDIRSPLEVAYGDEDENL